jgi:hypothetical protein
VIFPQSISLKIHHLLLIPATAQAPLEVSRSAEPEGGDPNKALKDWVNLGVITVLYSDDTQFQHFQDLSTAPTSSSLNTLKGKVNQLEHQENKRHPTTRRGTYINEVVDSEYYNTFI